MKLDKSENSGFSNEFEGNQVVRDICVDEGAFNTNIDHLKFSVEILNSKTTEIEEVDDSEIMVPVAVKTMIAKSEFYHFVSSDLKEKGKISNGEDECQPKGFQSLADLLSMPHDGQDGPRDETDGILEPLIREDAIVYSGGIAHAGSQSLRSESSATSARSFAFPM